MPISAKDARQVQPGKSWQDDYRLAKLAVEGAHSNAHKPSPRSKNPFIYVRYRSLIIILFRKSETVTIIIGNGGSPLLYYYERYGMDLTEEQLIIRVNHIGGSYVRTYFAAAPHKLPPTAKT